MLNSNKKDEKKRNRKHFFKFVSKNKFLFAVKVMKTFLTTLGEQQWKT